MSTRQQWSNPTFLSRPKLAFIAGPLILLSLLTSFLRHTGYPILSTEGLSIIILFTLIGMTFGLVMAFGGRFLFILMASTLVTFVIDIQSDWIFSLERLVIVFFIVVTMAWVIRANLELILCVVFGTVCLLNILFIPSAPLWSVTTSAQPVSPDPSLPPVVHIILDEHIGLEAISKEFDLDGVLAQSIRNSFLTRGYRVFGRAYSRFYYTQQSIPNALNFTASQTPSAFVGNPESQPVRMKTNATLTLLQSRGYWIHVIQSDFIDYCEIAGMRVANECATYTLENVSVVRKAPLADSDKVRFILSSFSRLSYIYKRTWFVYQMLRNSFTGRELQLPPWPRTFERVSSVSTMRAVDHMEETLRKAQPGHAYLIHLMLPHYPYAFDSRCSVYPDGSRWLYANADKLSPRRNDAMSRSKRYPLYLAQLTCTHQVLNRLLSALETSGVTDDALIIMHGDHGSRIDKGPPKVEFEDTFAQTDYMDAFGTFFVARLSGLDGGYDRRPFALETLLATIYQEGTIPNDKQATEPSVFFQKGASFVSRPLPPFAHGNPSSSW